MLRIVLPAALLVLLAFACWHIFLAPTRILVVNVTLAQQADMEIITREAGEIKRYTPSENQETSGPRGRRVGIAYELESGEIIYVPE